MFISIIHHSQMVEITQMSIKWQMDKHSVIYLYNWTSFCLKKEWNTETCYNMDESGK